MSPWHVFRVGEESANAGAKHWLLTAQCFIRAAEIICLVCPQGTNCKQARLLTVCTAVVVLGMSLPAIIGAAVSSVKHLFV